METVVTRFPPSPTGHLHIGGARTALFNWLYARHTKGKFVLRIEDTDTQRSTQASADGIIASLEWLGIDWDEGPYFQSDRTDIYKDYVQRLLDRGLAYYCDCSAEQLEEKRKQALAAGGNPVYDGTCREKGLSPSDSTVVRFRTPDTGKTILDDAVKGHIAVDNTETGDFVIFRSDGSPTYHFAVVVDDISMGVNTIIRGDDHVANTPRQIMLYRALDCELPLYAHVPMVLGSDRSRLSKRHGAMSVLEYRDMGFLPTGLLNYLVRLGWSYGDQEYFTMTELIEKFSLDHVGKSAGIFNPEKLLAINAEHIKNSPPEDLAGHLRPFLKEKGYTVEADQYLNDAVSTLMARSKTMQEMADKAAFYFENPLEYQEKAVKKFLTGENLQLLEMISESVGGVSDFTQDNLEKAFQGIMDATGIKFGKIAQPLRVAITGRTESPGIFETILTLGKPAVSQRLAAAISLIKNS